MINLSYIRFFFHNLNIPRVDLELAAELKDDISVEEVLEAIRSM